jgi:hypothetical protein
MRMDAGNARQNSAHVPSTHPTAAASANDATVGAPRDASQPRIAPCTAMNGSQLLFNGAEWTAPKKASAADSSSAPLKSIAPSPSATASITKAGTGAGVHACGSPLTAAVLPTCPEAWASAQHGCGGAAAAML